jgi:multisubunit Na+/H+ antiporter MnhB subunit
MVEMEEAYKLLFSWLWSFILGFTGINIFYIVVYYPEGGILLFVILAIICIWFIISLLLKIERKKILFIAGILALVLLSLSNIFPSFRGFISELPAVFDYFYRYK